MNLLLTQFGAEDASGIAALGVDGKALIIQLVTFVLAFLVLKKWAFTPIINMMDARRKTIEEGVALGEKMKQDEAQLQASIDQELAKARAEADGIVAAANETSRDKIREAEAKAQDKAAGVLKDAEERIKTDTARARKKLEGELVGLISDATEAIIGEKVDSTKDKQLIERALKEQQA
jgi:F-type H+-transporting ATPase subunit b